jgi:hypothetical protein
MYSRGQKKVGQCFFANVNLLAYGYYENIYLFIIVTPVYSPQFWLNFLIRLVLLFFVRDCIFVGGIPIFFNFHIWTTEVIPYNALNLEFANYETPCICFFLYELAFYHLILCKKT